MSNLGDEPEFSPFVSDIQVLCLALEVLVDDREPFLLFEQMAYLQLEFLDLLSLRG